MELDAIVVYYITFIPILVTILGYLLYLSYRDYIRKKIMIKMLSDSSSNILDTKKSVVTVEESSAIKKKLNFGGFISSYAVNIFYAISIGFGILVGFFIYMIMLSPIAFLISTLVFSLFPYMVLEKIISNRQEEFNFGLRSIIDKVTSMMRSGVGFEQAFKKAILTTKSEFTKTIFNIYLKEKDIIGEDKAFEKMFKLVESKELRIFYLVITIGRESGGKFSNTLDTLRQTLQDQGTIKQEIVSSTKEIKVGTYMIIALTVGIYMMMNSVFKGALNEHFFGSDTGKLQMFFIVIWVSFGIFVNNMMTKIKE